MITQSYHPPAVGSVPFAFILHKNLPFNHSLISILNSSLPSSSLSQYQIPAPMATLEDSSIPPHLEQQYPEMIMEAIEALNEKEGSNKTSIWRQIEAKHPDLPPSHSTLLSQHLENMKETGQLLFVNNNYKKPEANPQPKRGRGRPRKPRDPAAETAVVSPPRPRGRPPKRDPFFPPSFNQKSIATGSGKPRGRPPKAAKTEADSVAPAAAAAVSAAPPAEQSGVKRGRGRPPKVKPAVAPVAG